MRLVVRKPQPDNMEKAIPAVVGAVGRGVVKVAKPVIVGAARGAAVGAVSGAKSGAIGAIAKMGKGDPDGKSPAESKVWDAVFDQNKGEGEEQAAKMAWGAVKRMRKGRGGEGTRGGHVIGRTKSGKPIYATRKDHMKRVYDPGLPRARKLDENYVASTEPDRKTAYTANDHRDAARFFNEAATGAKNRGNHSEYQRFRNRSRWHLDIAKNATPEERLDKGTRFMAKGTSGEGTRGGKIIGHTTSGKPIYASHTGGSFIAKHKAWTLKDHREAATAHKKAANYDIVPGVVETEQFKNSPMHSAMAAAHAAATGKRPTTKADAHMLPTYHEKYHAQAEKHASRALRHRRARLNVNLREMQKARHFRIPGVKLMRLAKGAAIQHVDSMILPGPYSALTPPMERAASRLEDDNGMVLRGVFDIGGYQCEFLKSRNKPGVVTVTGGKCPQPFSFLCRDYNDGMLKAVPAVEALDRGQCPEYGVFRHIGDRVKVRYPGTH